MFTLLLDSVRICRFEYFGCRPIYLLAVAGKCMPVYFKKMNIKIVITILYYTPSGSTIDIEIYSKCSKTYKELK